MSKNLDLDLGLEDIAGQISETTNSQKKQEVSTEYMSKVATSLTESTKKARKKKGATLENCGEFTWITMPEYTDYEHVNLVTGEVYDIGIPTGKMIDFELESCNAENFVEWLRHVYPPARNIKPEDTKYYKEHKTRRKAFADIVNFYSKLPLLFKKYSGKEDIMGKKNKKKEKKEVKGD